MSPALHQSLPTLTVVRHILVCSPYIICTIVMLSVYRQKPPGKTLNNPLMLWYQSCYRLCKVSMFTATLLQKTRRGQVIEISGLWISELWHSDKNHLLKRGIFTYWWIKMSFNCAEHIPTVSRTTPPQNRDGEEVDPEYDDVIADVTTEHHFWHELSLFFCSIVYLINIWWWVCSSAADRPAHSPPSVSLPWHWTGSIHLWWMFCLIPGICA